jgi:hypothetical protein
MGTVVRFPERRHARASSKCLEAKRAKRSAERPAALARSVAKTRVHHSDGILSLHRHFEIVAGRAPTSAAIAAWESQSSKTDRNEVIESGMTESIGHSVLNFKDGPSLDCELALGQTVPMAPQKLLTDFELQFLARTYVARKQKFTQQEMAEELERGMKQDHYKQFEVRNRLPYEYLDRFIKLTGVTYEWLVAGRGPGPAWKDRYQQLLERQKKPKKGRKAA